MEGDLLLLFTRYPAEGEVKTRLARKAGRKAAAGIYRCCVSDTMANIRKAGYRPLVFFDPPSARHAMAEWLGHDLDYMPQEGGDLGARMEAAFACAFGSCSRAVLIGCDIPDLSPAIIREAFGALDSHGAVIGPASDGGYYLIGFSSTSFLPDIFHGIDWGGPLVFERTKEILEGRGVSFHVLPVLSDIDDYDDLKAFFERSKGLPAGALSLVDFLHENPW